MTSVESHECTIVLRDVCLYLEGSDPRLNARYGGPKIRGFFRVCRGRYRRWRQYGGCVWFLRPHFCFVDGRFYLPMTRENRPLWRGCLLRRDSHCRRVSLFAAGVFSGGSGLSFADNAWSPGYFCGLPGSSTGHPSFFLLCPSEQPHPSKV